MVKLKFCLVLGMMISVLGIGVGQRRVLEWRMTNPPGEIGLFQSRKQFKIALESGSDNIST